MGLRNGQLKRGHCSSNGTCQVQCFNRVWHLNYNSCRGGRSRKLPYMYMHVPCKLLHIKKTFCKLKCLMSTCSYVFICVHIACLMYLINVNVCAFPSICTCTCIVNYTS